MCILFIYRNPDADSESYRLIVATNRDEFLRRPALAAHYWKNNPKCIGGCDMEPGKEGGTWLGVSIVGKAGIVLNLSNEASSTDLPKQGRGFLVPNFLLSNHSAESYLNELHKENSQRSRYNPFLLVLLNLCNADVHYLSSSHGFGSGTDNVLGFGNSGLATPYKKVEAGKEIFKNIVNKATLSRQGNLIEELIMFLKSGKRYLPDPELQIRNPRYYKELSSIFVSMPAYGTRTHTILLVNGKNEITFVEETLTSESTWKREVFNEKLTMDPLC